MSARRFTRKEIEARNHRGDAAIIIDNIVYDVTGFLDDHPGGIEVLLDNAGTDATKCFRDVGHSDDAYTWREQYVMGEVVEEEKLPVEPREKQLDNTREPLSLGALVGVALPPLGLAIVSAVLYFYLFG
ncbi:cytochrome b5-like [Cydia strobilella]|uniref:cytochrome b5-like n=1 Tax=Cydia strobilella TaxID=1100964 RepID=UPI00300477E1